MAIRVITIDNNEDLAKAFKIREEVYIIEQEIPRAEEFDEFEDESIHLLALDAATPCGVCRWRFTENGVKLERFAVLQSYRGQQIGSALVSACIISIIEHPDFKDQKMYLNAQLSAMPLYKKFGFEPEGEVFMECDIEHMKMVKK
ncbi:GNAT family N-acetyltransferase [Fulvivirga sp.]|uniref:GNAT family N-acetyltransferase n=1 Tax=Fulvivirga sp. TaxID=1931237 RepID=UPI0032EE68FE